HPITPTARVLGTPAFTPTREQRACWGPRLSPHHANSARAGDPGFHPNTRTARVLGTPAFTPTREQRACWGPRLSPQHANSARAGDPGFSGWKVRFLGIECCAAGGRGAVLPVTPPASMCRYSAHEKLRWGPMAGGIIRGP